jgi:type IV pilus assembly protein PilE
MRQGNSGITLIELMIAVAIVGILVAVAVPSYRGYVIRGGRADAKAELMEASQELEKCFTRYGTYDAPVADCVALGPLTGAGRPSESGRYLLSFLPDSLTDNSYTLQAVPQGGQAADVTCGDLRLDQAGRRSVSVADADLTVCW